MIGLGTQSVNTKTATSSNKGFAPWIFAIHLFHVEQANRCITAELIAFIPDWRFSRYSATRFHVEHFRINSPLHKRPRFATVESVLISFLTILPNQTLWDASSQ